MQTGSATSAGPATLRGPGPAQEPLESIRRRLLDRGFLYDDPVAYRDGVEAALAAIERTLREPAC